MNRESERQRLIEKLDEMDLFLRNRASAKETLLNEYDIGIMQEYAKVADEAARMLENAIVPPCKVGDTLYTIYCYGIGDWRIETSTVYEVRKQIGFGRGIEIFGRVRNENGTHTFCRVELDRFGKTVFLTREEAEKMLKGVEK